MPYRVVIFHELSFKSLLLQLKRTPNRQTKRVMSLIFELASMASMEDLSKAIRDLETSAVEIELNAREMFKSAHIISTGSEPFDDYKWIAPRDEAWRDLQREVARQYEVWYSTALQYIKSCIPDRMEDFTKYYARDKFSFGVMDALWLLGGAYDDGDSTATINNYMQMFEMQRSLLRSIPSVMVAKEMLPKKSSNPVDLVCNLCERFQLVVRQLRSSHRGREPLDIRDEYDVQYLFHALLQLHFDDIRAEDATPAYAGGSTKIDFLMKIAQIGVETKMSRRGLGARELGNELMEDIGRYRAHPDCRTLICFVYDPEGLIANPRGVEDDLNKLGKDLRVQVFIRPL